MIELAKAFAGEAAACCMTEEPRYRADFKEDEVCRYWQMQQWPKKKKNPGEYWMVVQASVKKMETEPYHFISGG